jgi:soluble lytic murein transglycosylase-like protein
VADWKEGGELYLPALNAVEEQFGIPHDLLARIAYQECSFRPEVISGAVKSPAGAVGMMQLMPQFFPGAGVDWHADILTAATYLSQLHRQFLDWQLAVAAYNWGPGNVEHYENGEIHSLPQETENYVSDVFTDVPMDGALLNS